MGIAVKNVHDRMKGFFGSEARMDIESELGKGTTVTLVFPDCARQYQEGKAAAEVVQKVDVSPAVEGMNSGLGGDLVHKGGSGIQAELVDLVTQGERKDDRYV